MADFDSSLPVRTENDGDVVAKIADATIPSQQLTVNPDGSINVTDNGASLTVDATDFDIRDLDQAQDSVEVFQATHDNLNTNANIQVGDTDVDNTNPVPVSDSGGSLTVDATDLDTQDSVKIGDGTDFLEVNTDGSINVVIADGTPGTAINNYNTAAAIASGASSNHDYTVTALKTLSLNQIEASASGKMKIEVQVETAVASGIFNTRWVQFNSTAETNMSIHIENPVAVAAGVRVRVIRTNKDNQSQDVYSTISGYELP
jgi:hypothetical protein